ncbi:MAG: hypothetical protein M0R73_09655 [Dehalococcoidia bacterium]|nr:hypothetical protein [Dehalococcoidia bacterium]
MSEREPQPAPALKPLDLLEALGGLEVDQGVVCDIDDPDCVAPAAPPPVEAASDERTATD